jgi:Mor family transcriptional regulator
MLHLPERSPRYRCNIAPTEWPMILKRIDQGESLRQIALDYQVSETSVRRIERDARQALGLHDRPLYRKEKIAPAEWPELLQRHEQGETLHQLAPRYGLTYETLRRILRKARTRNT